MNLQKTEFTTILVFAFAIVIFNIYFIIDIKTILIEPILFKRPNIDAFGIVSLNKNECDPIIIKNNSSYSATLDDTKYPQIVLLHENKSINFECLNRNKEIKKIMFWNTWFGDEQFGVGLGVRVPFQDLNCPVTNCELLNDKSRINESDYVIVHMWDKLEPPPMYRPMYQRWIFMTYESPLRSYDYTKYNGFFNLTSTYKMDSNFPGMYQVESGIIWEKNETFKKNHDYSFGKSNFAAAVISNCRSDEKSNRFDYVNELKKYISVDIYGRCGAKCPTFFKNNQSGECKQIIGSEYKFYLAFENSICIDYITEKMFSILKYDIIPIVMGGGPYEKYVSDSF